MNYLRATALLLFFGFALLAQAQDLGKYLGTVQTEWLEDGRHMRLLAPFAYIDPQGVEWHAPSGSVVDGASIPQAAWTFIGGPFEGKYRNASVIHDVGCDQKRRPWEAVHEVFYWAMLAAGVETWRAKVMYAAVYHFGPRWPRQVNVANLPINQDPVAQAKALEGAAPGSTAQIINKFSHGRSFTEILTNQPEKADFTILVTPPQQRLNDFDFEKLKQSIETRENNQGTELSLEDIRAFR